MRLTKAMRGLLSLGIILHGLFFLVTRSTAEEPMNPELRLLESNGVGLTDPSNPDRQAHRIFAKNIALDLSKKTLQDNQPPHIFSNSANEEIIHKSGSIYIVLGNFDGEMQIKEICWDGNHIYFDIRDIGFNSNGEFEFELLTTYIPAGSAKLSEAERWEKFDNSHSPNTFETNKTGLSAAIIMIASASSDQFQNKDALNKTLTLKMPKLTFQYKIKNIHKTLSQTVSNSQRKKQSPVGISEPHRIPTLEKTDHYDSQEVAPAVLDVLTIIENFLGLNAKQFVALVQEFYKKGTEIMQEELLQLRKYYAELYLLMQEFEIESPAAPELKEMIDQEEIEWRKKIDQLVYKILLLDSWIPENDKKILFKTKYGALYTNLALPVLERYDHKIKSNLTYFIKQLKDILANKTDQVIIRPTRESTEYLIAVSTENSPN